MPSGHWVATAALFVASFATACVLLLSQSRSAWFAGIAGVAVLGILRYRFALPALGLLGVAAAAAIVWRPRVLIGLVGHARNSAWTVAIDAMAEHPIAGIGLGALRGLAETLQASNPEPLLPLAHAHNVFLQVAVDTGVFGLAAYLALLVSATCMAARVARRQGGHADGMLAAGLCGALVAVHVFGLTDAIALGAKVGVFMWWALGLIAALHSVDDRSHRR
jgi:putative inorganic carbon (HCO3(-)) transporter